ncbi:MAG: twin-arginine translocase TatA/TatE family subunit [Rickettsiaceae bacterium]|nr:twin-arginine translocase TatA/TatE family subunit [Rickettsiaceae bacterium]
MSLSEILVVLLVALFVIKPEDIPGIAKYIKKTLRYFRKIRSEIISAVEDDDHDVAEINKYLSKITAIGEKYEGSYDLEEIKAYYHKILKNKS